MPMPGPTSARAPGPAPERQKSRRAAATRAPQGPQRRRGTAPSPAWKRARASLRTGVRPVGNGLGLRCLLGARAPPGSNPPPSRGLRRGPLPRCAWHKRDLRDPSSGTTRSGRLTAPADWPGAGLRSNLPLIAPMSTSPGCCDHAVIGAATGPVPPCPAAIRLSLRLLGDGSPIRLAGKLEDEHDRESRDTGVRDADCGALARGRIRLSAAEVHRPGQRRRPGNLRPVQRGSFP